MNECIIKSGCTASISAPAPTRPSKNAVNVALRIMIDYYTWNVHTHALQVLRQKTLGSSQDMFIESDGTCFLFMSFVHCYA